MPGLWLDLAGFFAVGIRGPLSLDAAELGSQHEEAFQLELPRRSPDALCTDGWRLVEESQSQHVMNLGGSWN